MTSNKTALGEEVEGVQVEDLVSLDKELELIIKVDPKEWQHLHNEWLHAAMRAMMGDTTLKLIPDLDNVKKADYNPPSNTLELEPA